MKKYLIAGALALICNCLLTSCSEDLGNYSSPEEAKKAQFAQNFEKFYGTPDPNQDWGFGDASVVAARTRGVGDNYGTVIKRDMTGYPSDIEPDPITDAERAWVTEWFQTHEGLTEQGQPFENFFIQYVSGDDNNKPGVWHKDSGDEAFYDNGGMDKLHVGAVRDQNQTVHVLDFNAKSGGPWGIVYIQNGSALQFGYHSSYGTDDQAPNGDGYYWYFNMVNLTVPGKCFSDGQARDGWYVGLSLYSKKWDNGYRELGLQRLQFAEDWILKVVPGNGNTNVNTKTTGLYKKKTVCSHKWIFCEDLGSSSSNKDYDYNDLVFDVKVIDECKVLKDEDGNETAYTDDPSHTYYAEVTPLAAGGELTIKFNALSTNAHDMFNPAVASNVLVNTCRSNQEISMSHVEGRAGTTGVIPFNTYNEAIDLSNIVVMVRSSLAAYELSAYKGEAPHKICVPVGTRWAYERTDIKDAYTGFENYVATRIEPWSTTGVEDNLYPLDGVAYEMKNDQTGTSSYEKISSSSTTEYSYTLADATNETVWWDDITGNTTFYTKSDGNWDGNVFVSANDLKAAEIGNGTIIRFYFASDNGYMLRVSDTNWSNFDLGNNGWDQNFIQGGSKNGYVEFKLNTTTANHLKQYGLRIYGTGLTALALTYDNSQKVADEVPAAESEIWTGPLDFGWSNKISLARDAFMNKGIKAGSIIRFYMQSSATSYGGSEKDWNFKIFTGYEQGWTMNDCDKNGYNTNISNGYFDYVLTSDDAQVLAMEKNLGWTAGSSLQIQGEKFILNKITLIP